MQRNHRVPPRLGSHACLLKKSSNYKVTGVSPIGALVRRRSQRQTSGPARSTDRADYPLLGPPPISSSAEVQARDETGWWKGGVGVNLTPITNSPKSTPPTQTNMLVCVVDVVFGRVAMFSF